MAACRGLHLYEFEAKKWLYRFGLPMQVGDIAFTPTQAREIAESLKYQGYKDLVVKAQILSSGRKKAGGIIFTKSPNEVEREAHRLLGSSIVTSQTGSEGDLVKAISICEKVDVVNEHYLAFVQNRSSPTGIEVIL